jgi:hypothetical protein
MRRKLIVLALAITLVLTILTPMTVLATGAKPPPAKHFSIIMTPTNIDDTSLGTVWPVRDSAATNVWPIIDMVTSDGTPAPTIVGWIIEGRSIYGTIDGDMKGNFTFTYGGIVDILQSGSIQGIGTLQAGGLNIVYLAARGEIESQVEDLYTFTEIQTWCAGVGITLGTFFAQIYNTPELAELPDTVLQAMYEAGQLPPLPKTLTAVISGTVKIDSGTGIYSGIRGIGQLQSYNNKPLILSVWPNQHVWEIDGKMKMTGFYTNQPPRQLGNIDREKLLKAIEEFKAN